MPPLPREHSLVGGVDHALDRRLVGGGAELGEQEGVAVRVGALLGVVQRQ